MAATVSNSSPENFSLNELVDLALCSPEVGAVNFNILRLVLRELVSRAGNGKEIHPKLDDFHSNQIQNFKKYIQGAGNQTPPIGVIRINQGPRVLIPGQTPRTGRNPNDPQQIPLGQSFNQLQGQVQGFVQQGNSGQSGGLPPAGQNPQQFNQVQGQTQPQFSQGQGQNLPQANQGQGNTQQQGNQGQGNAQKQVNPGQGQNKPQGQGQTQQGQNQPQGSQGQGQIQQGQNQPQGNKGQGQIQQQGNQGQVYAQPQGGQVQGQGQPGMIQQGPQQDHVNQEGTVQQYGRPSGQAPIYVRDKEIEAKVARLERHLEALYQLPTNTKMLEGGADNAGMNVQDMWQVIQLNNRTAACEAAIQKMASLIEDLAKELRTTRRLTQTQVDEQMKRESLGNQGQVYAQPQGGQVQGQGQPQGSQGQGQIQQPGNQGQVYAQPQGPDGQQAQPFLDKCDEAKRAVDSIRGELDDIKQQWKTGGVDNFDKSGGQQSKPTSARGQQGDTDVKVLARIGATEGAIRKLANLIEDLAKELRALKRDKEQGGGGQGAGASGTSGGKVDQQGLGALKTKTDETKKAVNVLQDDLENLKKQWKEDIDKLQQGQQVLKASLAPPGTAAAGPHNPLQAKQMIQLPGQGGAPGHPPGVPTVVPGISPGQPGGLFSPSQAVVGPHGETSGPAGPGGRPSMLGVSPSIVAENQGQFESGQARPSMLGAPTLSQANASPSTKASKTRTRRSPSEEKLLRREKGVAIISDLDQLRERLRAEGKIPAVFHETEVLERLATLWEAVDIMKRNQEHILLRLLKLDNSVQKLPQEHLDALREVPVGHLESLAGVADMNNLAAHPNPSRLSVMPSTAAVTEREKNRDKIVRQSIALGLGLPSDDLQTIFTNLSHLLTELDEQKERTEQMFDMFHGLETVVVTKEVLADALGDKADKGQMNTKVSYDEFGNSVDEITNQIQNLLVEVYQKNEGWKRITDEIFAELAEKMGKEELAPLRAYFKSHIGTLESQVAELVKQFNEPDPAGTRKKILRDLNCISCDRHVNISGKTNANTLPCMGAVLAGHTTASKHAYDLCNLRNNARTEQPYCDLNAIEKVCGSRFGQQKDILGSGSRQSAENSSEYTVNRYQGGSHTAISTGERVASIRRPYTGVASGTTRASAPAPAKVESDHQNNNFFPTGDQPRNSDRKSLTEEQNKQRKTSTEHRPQTVAPRGQVIAAYGDSGEGFFHEE